MLSLCMHFATFSELPVTVKGESEGNVPMVRMDGGDTITPVADGSTMIVGDGHSSEALWHEMGGFKKTILICKICGKSFGQKNLMTRHMLTMHMGKKTHQCDVCRACFADLASLMAHRMIHTGLRPYKCMACGLEFLKMEMLKVHRCARLSKQQH